MGWLGSLKASLFLVWAPFCGVLQRYIVLKKYLRLTILSISKYSYFFILFFYLYSNLLKSFHGAISPSLMVLLTIVMMVVQACLMVMVMHSFLGTLNVSQMDWIDQIGYLCPVTKYWFIEKMTFKHLQMAIYQMFLCVKIKKWPNVDLSVWYLA